MCAYVPIGVYSPQPQGAAAKDPKAASSPRAQGTTPEVSWKRVISLITGHAKLICCCSGGPGGKVGQVGRQN